MNQDLSAFWAPVLALIASTALLGTLLRSGLAWRLALDHPNERSLHVRPTPRIGGLGIVLGIILAALIWSLASLLLVACVLGLALVSYFDDRVHVPVSLRFAAHLAAAAAWTVSFVPVGEIWLIGLLVLAIGWAINLYNFMDGSDGLAGGMAVIGFSSLAFAAGRAGHPDLAWMCVSVAAGSLGFLFYNFPPAKLFMGDVGSVPLGFLAGAMGSFGWYQGAWPFWLPVLVFAPFLVDATVTLGRRLLGGQKVWVAHRDHYYQRLVRMGWSHRRTALAEYALMIALGAAGLVIVRLTIPGQVVGLITAACILIALMVAVDGRWQIFVRSQGHA